MTAAVNHQVDEVLAAFAVALRAAGVPVTMDRTQAFLRACAIVGADDTDGVYWAGRATLCAEHGDVSQSRGEFDVDAGQAGGRPIGRLWLEPPAAIHPAVAEAIRSMDAVIIGPGSYYTSLLPIFLVDGCREALAEVRGPIIYVANLLTEGRGMTGFTAAQAVERLTETIGRAVDVVIVNSARPADDVLQRYAEEHKFPLPLGRLPSAVQVIEGDFWRGPIARHDRRRLRTAAWSALVDRIFINAPVTARP